MPARLATVEDSDAITETIATAFYDDPFWSWAFADDSQRAAQFRVWWRVFVDAAFRNGNWTWVDRQLRLGRVVDAARRHKMSAGRRSRARCGSSCEFIDGDHRDEVLEVLARFEAAHPHDVPHYYLSIVATHDDYRGHGYAEAMLAENLKLVDAEHMPAYLESSNPAEPEALHAARASNRSARSTFPTVAPRSPRCGARNADAQRRRRATAPSGVPFQVAVQSVNTLPFQ